MPDPSALAEFIKRWAASGGNELANSQPFLGELCGLLGLTPPEPAKSVNEDNAYSFERKVYLPRGDGTFEMKRLDLYKRGCFVLEAKQGKEAVAPTSLTLPMPGLTKSSAAKRGTRAWEDTMARAKRQAEYYVRALPAEEGRPPFIIVADVGYCFDLYAEFSCTGGMYIPFPDARSYRIKLEGLARPEIQDLFRALWNDPLSLDPSRRSARVTTEISKYLAELAKSLEADDHSPEEVAAFLIRCLFTMFAEDVGLLPANSFQDILGRSAATPEVFPCLAQDLWTAMNAGEVSAVLGQRLRKFNGNIFADPQVLPLSGPQIAILLEAARADWREVEPAIFGTMLEQALNPGDRQKLGAHYTPRAYVERLVLPTVIIPLREDWHNVQAAASMLADQGKPKEAQALIADFHRRLCAVRVLDPACGSGNFLYVTLEHMKRLEAEVLNEAKSYGAFQTPMETKGLSVDPHQFLGLELNPRAAHIAEMVLWIGYLQWHYRTYGTVAPPEPIIRTFHNIEHRDAVLEYDGVKPALDKSGQPITRWDGQTMKTDPVTGRDVPDEAAQVAEVVYEKPRPATWPEAEFIVGNPPFIGGGGDRGKRAVLGGGAFEALAKAYRELPEACDFVMYWWHNAANLVREGKARRFGFITTNSLRQVFNRRVIALHLGAKPPLSLAFAVPDHPWSDASGSAAVRIAMSVGQVGRLDGCLATVIEEVATGDFERHILLSERVGRINSNLTIGVDVTSATQLRANQKLSSQGMKLHGSGFIVNQEKANELGFQNIDELKTIIRPYRNGKDVTDRPRNEMVIDLFGLTDVEIRERFPEVFQWIFERVKPERDQNNRASYRELWWIFGEPRSEFRPALAELSRYIATVRVAKHRVFIFLDSNIIPESRLMAIALSDAYFLGILSSKHHVSWSLAAGGFHGVGDDPTYNNTLCFDPYPFPDPTPELKEHIRDLGERLDAHRKDRQALHPKLTLTGMYNVLEALRTGRELSEAERVINEQGLISILRQLHDELDAAVAQAYGWPVDLPEAEILSRLVALNHERAEEEKKGIVRWLRPEYQCRDKSAPQRQARLGLEVASPKKGRKPAARMARVAPLEWPTTLLDQFQAVRSALASLGGNANAEAVARFYTRAPRSRVQSILDTMASQGFIRIGEDGVYRLT